MTMIMSTVLMNIVFADLFNNQSAYEIYNKVSMYNDRLDNELYMSPMRNINQNDLMWKVMYGEGINFIMEKMFMDILKQIEVGM